MKKNIKIIPLGGVREEGKDLFAIEVNDQSIFILDCGSKFPLDEMLGIDFVIPDFTYIRENADKVVGIFLTSGHLDSIGALPYLLSEFDVPVFGTDLTIRLARHLVKQHHDSRNFDNFQVINEKSEIVFDDGTVTFFSVTHSIPDAMGIALKTDQGTVVYTGDFKFDQTVPADYQTDFPAIIGTGKERVLALLADARNAEAQGQLAEERVVQAYLSDTFEFQDSRLVLTCMAENLLRLQEIFNAAAASERKIYFATEHGQTIFKIAQQAGKLKLPDPKIVIKSAQELAKLDDGQIIILHLGQPGEAMRSLARMANQHDPHVQIETGDLVLLTTAPYRSMDNAWAKTRDLVYQAGGTVTSVTEALTVADDATRSDLQLMLGMVKPDYFLPVQGEYRQLAAAKEAALASGYQDDQIYLAAKGDQLQFDDQGLTLGEAAPAADTMIDGIGVGDIGNIVLRDRNVLSQDGVFIAVVTIDRKKRRIVEKPKITSRGFIYNRAHHKLLKDASDLVIKTVESNLDNQDFDWSHLKQDVREKLSSFLYKKTDRRPVILPVIMEVNQHHRRSKANKKKKDD
ncbi:RNA-metabolising Zn-dependent hydrolase [Fructilactobacillus florum 8D]|uniref:RNA-metabolising Zn-dependent hydrolase n=1 Tax=Fructilactobacillus florum 8D TaxID=1221538 RepID=W9ED83_9LACO|nr:ribonuclease J [Fructilactobacillus florum]ETO40027.1 RNA-metabolising Zn-dependent hydrolase [Fructilactobacillus florum 8D]